MQHGHEVAGQFDARWIARILGRRDHDLLNQRPGGLEHLLAIPGVERLSQGGDPLRVDLRQVGMQGGRSGGRRDCLLLQRLPLHLELIQLSRDARRPDPVGDRLDQVGDLPLHCLESILACLCPGGRLCRHPAPFRDEGVAERGEHVRLHQVAGEGREHLAVQGRAAHAGDVAAGAGVLRAGAGEIVLAQQRKGPAAAAADDLAGQQVPGPAAFPERGFAIGAGGDRLGGEPRLGGLPQLVGDDPELRKGDLDDVLAGLRAMGARPGDGVGLPAEAVPYGPACIGGIAQNAVAAPRAAADRAVDPVASGGRWDAFLVQATRNGQRAPPGDILLVDTVDDGGVLGDDLAQPALDLAVGTDAADHAVAVGRHADAVALAQAAFEATLRLGREVLEIEGAHRTLHADMQVGDLALGEGDEPHPTEGDLFVERGDMLEVAGEAVEALGEDGLEPARRSRLAQRLEAGPLVLRPGDGGVREGVDHGPALPLGAGVADAQLVLDRGLALVLGGVARVEGDARTLHVVHSAVPRLV